MSAVITPTPGRIVWYWPSVNDGVPSLPGQPLAAIVASVHTDRRVNLSVIDSYGNHHARGNVSLIQPDDIRPQPGSFNFAEWMPYQIGAAGIKPVEPTPEPVVETDATPDGDIESAAAALTDETAEASPSSTEPAAAA